MKLSCSTRHFLAGVLQHKTFPLVRNDRLCLKFESTAVTAFTQIAILRREGDMSLRRTTTTSKSSMKDVSGPIFSPSVDTIVFTDYEPFQKYKQTISFRNNDTVCVIE